MYTTSQDGRRSPFFNAGIDRLSDGKIVARLARTRHQKKTEANWMIVRVAGLGKAFKIDLEDVFVSAEVMYQAIQSAYNAISSAQKS